MGNFLGNFWETLILQEVAMVKKNYKGRCIKLSLTESKDVLKLYSKIQERCAVLLQEDEKITEIRCNVPLDGLSVGDYTSDFVCRKKNKDILVRECVRRCHLTKPMTVKLLDASRNYWLRHGVMDWGIVIDEERTV